MSAFALGAGSLPGWRVVLLVIHVLLTGFGCFVTFQFYKYRGAFFMKMRFPGLALLQLVACTLGLLADGVVYHLVLGTAVHCFLKEVLGTTVSSLVMFIHVLRAAKLYMRIYIGRRLAKSRVALGAKLERQYSASFKTATLPALKAHSSSSTLSRNFRLVKYSVLGFFGFLLVADGMIRLGGYIAADFACLESLSTADEVLAAIILVSGLICATALLIAIREFQDNFNIHLELTRTVVTYFVVCPLFLVLGATSVTTGGEYNESLAREILPFCYAVFIAIVGVYPLRDQRELDKRVESCNFNHLESFSDVLEDPAALVALETFMRREFCEEMLEFYQAVEKYKHKYELHTPEKRLNAAHVIYAQFISPGAPAQINLSLTHIAEIHVKLFGGSDCEENSDKASTSCITDSPIDVFDAAQRIIVKLIREDPFVRFIVSRLPKSPDARRSSLSRRMSTSRRSSFSTRVSIAKRTSVITTTTHLAVKSHRGQGEPSKSNCDPIAEANANEESQSSIHEHIESNTRRGSSTRRLSLASRRSSGYSPLPKPV